VRPPEGVCEPDCPHRGGGIHRFLLFVRRGCVARQHRRYGICRTSGASPGGAARRRIWRRRGPRARAIRWSGHRPPGRVRQWAATRRQRRPPSDHDPGRGAPTVSRRGDQPRVRGRPARMGRLGPVAGAGAGDAVAPFGRAPRSPRPRVRGPAARRRDRVHRRRPGHLGGPHRHRCRPDRAVRAGGGHRRLRPRRRCGHPGRAGRRHRAAEGLARCTPRPASARIRRRSQRKRRGVAQPGRDPARRPSPA
jgi:hypothetical protein